MEREETELDIEIVTTTGTGDLLTLSDEQPHHHPTTSCIFFLAIASGIFLAFLVLILIEQITPTNHEDK